MAGAHRSRPHHGRGRVDRLGVGDSEGVDVQATSVTDDVASFRSALSKLRTYDFVDPDRVFIFGHSLGTTIVPVVAKDQKLAGVISFASVYRPWPETILESMQQRWKLELLPEDQIKKRTDSVKAFLDQFVTKKQPLDSVLEGNAEYREIFGEGALDRGFIGMPAKYAQDLATLPSASAWGAVNAPVLAIWGEADYIAARGDGEKLAETVNKAHAGKGCFLKLPEVDHMMSKAADQEESFLAGQGTFNPKFIEAVLKWMTDKGC